MEAAIKLIPDLIPSSLEDHLGEIFKSKNDPKKKTTPVKLDSRETPATFSSSSRIINSVWHSEMDQNTGDPLSPTKELESHFLDRYELDDEWNNE